MCAVLSDLRFRWTDQGDQLHRFRRNASGWSVLQPPAPPNRPPTLSDGVLPETDQLAYWRLGTGERGQQTQSNTGSFYFICTVYLSYNLSLCFSSSALRVAALANASVRWSAQTERGTCTLCVSVTPTPNLPLWSAATPSPATGHRVSTWTPKLSLLAPVTYIFL